MLTWMKQSALAFAAYQISSVVTIFQMAGARVVAPDTYNWLMDLASGPALYAGQLLSVVWEFLTSG